MLWPGTKYVSMNFKEKYRKLYAQNSFRMFSLRGWRARCSLARKSKIRVTPFGILWNFWHVTQQSSPRLRDETVTVPVVLLYWL